MADINNGLAWTFLTKCEPTEDIKNMLVDGEQIFQSFKTIRDVAAFTNKRLIVRDAQGLTGKKIEIYSLPYSQIIMWSTENAGKFLDINAEVELWTKAGNIKIKLDKSINIREFDLLLANAVL